MRCFPKTFPAFSNEAGTALLWQIHKQLPQKTPLLKTSESTITLFKCWLTAAFHTIQLCSLENCLRFSDLSGLELNLLDPRRKSGSTEIESILEEQNKKSLPCWHIFYRGMVKFWRVGKYHSSLFLHKNKLMLSPSTAAGFLLLSRKSVYVNQTLRQCKQIQQPSEYTAYLSNNRPTTPKSIRKA